MAARRSSLSPPLVRPAISETAIHRFGFAETGVQQLVGSETVKYQNVDFSTEGCESSFYFKRKTNNKHQSNCIWYSL